MKTTDHRYANIYHFTDSLHANEQDGSLQSFFLFYVFSFLRWEMLRERLYSDKLQVFRKSHKLQTTYVLEVNISKCTKFSPLHKLQERVRLLSHRFIGSRYEQYKLNSDWFLVAFGYYRQIKYLINFSTHRSQKSLRQLVPILPIVHLCAFHHIYIYFAQYKY